MPNKLTRPAHSRNDDPTSPRGAALVDVFIDECCDVLVEPEIATMGAESIDITSAESRALLTRRNAILVIGSGGTKGMDFAETVSALRRHAPHVIIVVCARSHTEFDLLPRFARAGIDEFVPLLGAGDISYLVQLISERRQVSPPAQELFELATIGTGGWELSAVLHCLRNAHRPRSVDDVAARLGYSARRFRELLVDAQYPGPRDVLKCGRFLYAAELRERGIVVASELARRLGFATATEMRKQCGQLRRAVRSRTALQRFVHGMPRLLRTLGPANPNIDSGLG